MTQYHTFLYFDFYFFLISAIDAVFHKLKMQLQQHYLIKPVSDKCILTADYEMSYYVL